ncbi:hypothetical protein LTR70_004855 [Exophiala xenobiotica]|uniref:Uncharacterized protein n=1 Tax=Lithohypha guttulata TaxID=1690604 RepID=A0ABR0KDQ5_9EURO|nr:hypothetical protein LTR24_004473 [Lithohypha guttulata]KAK5319810.1 hypothetical protein LTR70_004855 [Exophiala xenobiotica]
MLESKSRLLDQEPDCVAVVPDHPDFVVIGTYSLVESDQHQASNERIGFLQILPFFADNKDIRHVELDRQDFTFGIYDVHFHPKYRDVLGVATSDAEIRFFSLIAQRTAEESKLCRLHFVYHGHVIVEAPDPSDGHLAVVTQFQFIEQDLSTDTRDTHVLLVATTQFGNTKIVKTTLSASSTDPETSHRSLFQRILVHKQSFGLEAWTTLPLLDAVTDQLLVLSGGDDGQLIVSSVSCPHSTAPTNNELDLETLIPTKLHVDKRTHEAGIVSICFLGVLHPLPRDPSQSAATSTTPKETLILTGSYDEHLRLFLLTQPSSNYASVTLKLLTELKLNGGVWRIELLDQYPTGSESINHHYILLIAGHTAGAFIIRLSCKRTEDKGGERQYAFTIEKHFTEHDSLVYAVCANRVETNEPHRKWHVLSTSFYDKKVCNWEWTDENKQP